MSGNLFKALIVGASVLHASARAQEKPEATTPVLTLSTSYDHTNGTYGTANQLPASTWSFGAIWDINDNWSLDIDVPYLRQTTPVVVGASTVRIVRVGGKLVAVKGLVNTTRLDSVTGQGDVTALLSRSFDSGSGPVWNVGSKVKFATASASAGLGTGKADASLQIGVVNDFGPWTLGGTVGYTLVGKVAGLELHNFSYFDIDSSYKASEEISVGANLAGGQSPVAGSAALLTSSFSVNYKFAHNSYLTANILRGLSDGSPKWGAGLTLNVGF